MSETGHERAFSRHLRIGPFFKALLISILIEFAVLVLTGASVASSMMRHSAAAPRPFWEDILANIGILFHFPSILIVTPLGLFIFAPLVQIALMTCILGLIFRAHENRRKPPLPFLT
jgi:predicted membrane-bound mannosyltransferase